MAHAPARSPLAPDRFPDVAPVAGVELAARACGVKYPDRLDLLLARFVEGTQAAGVLTRSKTASAPVLWCRRQLQHGRARALVVNAGNANAFTGKLGVGHVEATVDAASRTLGVPADQVFVASTGVIGEPLPADRLTDALPEMKSALRADLWEPAASAIMTTDTFPKAASRTCEIAGRSVTLSGIAKGSGMIAPDMATMLAFVFPDAALPASVLDALMRPAVDRTFNAITVDGDTSTSDTLLLFATGQAGHPVITDPKAHALGGFRRALEDLCRDLAHQVVRDGEGASKFVTIDVSGAVSRRAAKRIALSIANSPLVKTAISGEDANWGRIVMAVGKAGEEADRDRLAISIGGIAITQDGQLRHDYDEGPVARHMKGSEIDIAVDVGARDGRGRGRATVWTCDLSHGYVTINADYRS